MADKDPTDLVRHLQTDPGDEEAQRKLYERYQSRLVGFCRARLNDLNDAEDCAQDIFQDVFAGIGELREPDAFESWMFTIARRRVGGYNARRKPTELPSPGDDALPDLPDPVTDVERDVRMRELLGTVSDAIDSLQHPLDEVMRTFITGGGLRGSELAPRFGWNTSRADHELNRARSGLFDALETLVVVRTGRDACADLNNLCSRQRIRPGRVARLNQAQRRSVHRHIAQCGICGPQAVKARDRGQWALGPGIAQLADYLRRRRSGRRLVAAAFVAIAMISLPATSEPLSPGRAPNVAQQITTPRPTPTTTPSSVPPPKPSPSPRVRREPTSPGGNRGGGDTTGPAPPPTQPVPSPSPPRTTAPPRTPPPRTPPPRTAPPSRTAPPARTQDCTTTIALDPLTVRVNAVLLCVSISVGG